MRLRKTMYATTYERELIGYDERGRPIYDDIPTYHSIKCEIEPYSNKLAETTYGVFADTTNRAFSHPHELLQLKEIVKHKDKLYEITEVIKYDKHYETLLKELGDADE